MCKVIHFIIINNIQIVVIICNSSRSCIKYGTGEKSWWFEICVILLICMKFNVLYFNDLKILLSCGDWMCVVQNRMPWLTLVNYLRTVNFTIGENIENAVLQRSTELRRIKKYYLHSSSEELWRKLMDMKSNKRYKKQMTYLEKYRLKL